MADPAADAEVRAADQYLQILAAIGARADEMGPRPLASHWPYRGSAYRPGGLLYAGQALDGWDAAVSSARWWASDVATAEGRDRVLAGTQAWHADLPEPLWGVLQYPWRRGSSFWTLAREVAAAVAPGPGPWHSRIAWANVYPVGHERLESSGLRAASPSGALREVQDPHVGRLFASLVEMLDPARVVIVAGPAYWHWAEATSALDLHPAPFPLIRSGRRFGRSWVVGDHPSYSRKVGKRYAPSGGSNAYYVQRSCGSSRGWMRSSGPPKSHRAVG